MAEQERAGQERGAGTGERSEEQRPVWTVGSRWAMPERKQGVYRCCRRPFAGALAAPGRPGAKRAVGGICSGWKEIGGERDRMVPRIRTGGERYGEMP